jgi:mannose-6-phosphate isomerase-like protein (cupin superfamily)
MSLQNRVSAGQPYLLDANEGLHNDSSLKASYSSTLGQLSLIESKTTGGAPLHIHSREDEYFYVLEGVIRGRVGDESFEAGPRSFVFLPRNIPHQWDVVGDEATLLMMTIPAGLDQFLHEYHAASTIEERQRIATHYGITFL